MNFQYKSPILVLAMICLMITSCTTTKKTDTSTTQEVAVTKEETRTQQPTTPAYGECVPCPLVKLAPRASEQASLGQDYEADVDVMAVDNAADVIVMAGLPQGVSYVKSEPAAETAEGKLVWRFASIAKGKNEKIRIWLKANQVGQNVCCFSVVARPFYCVTTTVGKPMLELVKTGPAQALLNSMITYTITVKNSGNAVCNNLVVTDQLPDGLTHESGQKALSFTVGDLNPGESKEIQVVVKAAQIGRYCNVATATTSNAGELKAEACTEVQSMDATIQFICSKTEYLKNKSTNTVSIENVGQTALSGMQIVASCDPANVTILEAGFDKNSGKCTWTIDSLGPKEKKEISFRATSALAGKHCIKITATTAEGVTKETECCTDWQGIPAILIEVVDEPDPVKIGDENLYTIIVTNQGTKADTNITIQAIFADEVDAVSAQGESVQASVSAKEVTFSPYPVLAPKQKITYTITGKGAKEGDHRLRVILKSDFLNLRGKPVTEEESTNVY